MKICILILILTFFSSDNIAQTTQPAAPKIIENSEAAPCTLKSGDLPAVRGLRLDMSKTQVRKEYPLMKITADPVVSNGIAMNSQISNPEYKESIDRITVAFRNDKVFSILLTYTDSTGWDSSEEFADKISQSLNLPKARSRKNAGGVYYSVNCGDFAVRTRINGDNQPMLLLTKDPDDLWESTGEKKKAFKP